MKKNILLAILTICSINPSFAGNKIAIGLNGNHYTLVNLSKLEAVKKDRFESSNDFAKRLCEQTSNTLHTLGVSGNEPIVVGIEKIFKHYDADRHEFVFEDYLYDVGDYHSIDIVSEDDYSYSGKEVIAKTKTSAVLYFINPDRRYPDQLTITLPSKPEDARRIESDLRLAFIVKVQSPCFHSYVYHKAQTINEMGDTLSQVGFVVSQNSEWVIYLNSTKEILKRGKLISSLRR